MERHQRAPNVAVVDHAEQLQSGFRGRGSVVGDAHDGVDRGEQSREDLEGAGGVAGVEAAHHLAQLEAGGVTDDRDDPGGAVGQPTEVGDVVAGVDGVPHLDELDAAGVVTDGILHGHDRRPRAGFGVGLQLDGGACAAGDVVEHDREVAGLHHAAEVVEDARLARFVVVRRHQEQPVDPDLGRLLGELHGVSGGVGAHPRHNRGAIADRVLDGQQDLAVLGDGRGGRFASRAADHDPVVAVVDEVGRDLGGARQVDRAVVVERGRHRREDAPERRSRGVGHAVQAIAHT